MSIAAYQGVCPTCRHDHSADILAPTTRETADHAELARRAEDKANAHIRNLRLAASRDFAVSGYSDGLIVEQDMRGMLLAAADALDTLLSEIAALRGERDEAHELAFTTYPENGASVTWKEMFEEQRSIANASARLLTQAERQRDELRKALETIGEMAPSTCETSLAHDMAQFANQALANQGADQ